MADEHTPVLEEPPRAGSRNGGSRSGGSRNGESNAEAPAPPTNNRGNFTRNLNTEPDESVAKKMFFGGLLLLPWLHVVTVFFYRKQFMDASIDAQVTKWVRRSFIAALFWTVVFIAWAVVFQTQWKELGWAKLVMVLPDDNLDVGW